jgi:RimJ/RimL family protein N-acetyltransferase
VSKPIEQPILLDVPDHFVTDRLHMRVPRAGDSRLVFPAVMDSHSELTPWFPWAPDVTEHRIESFTRLAAANFLLRQQFHYSLYLKGTDTCLGTCGISRLDWTIPMFEISYWLRTPYCGRGYMSEAVAAVERLCFDVFDAGRVEIRADFRNARSRRVAERAGYTLDGILRRQRRDTAGQLCDMCVYAKIADS